MSTCWTWKEIPGCVSVISGRKIPSLTVTEGVDPVNFLWKNCGKPHAEAPVYKTPEERARVPPPYVTLCVTRVTPIVFLFNTKTWAIQVEENMCKGWFNLQRWSAPLSTCNFPCFRTRNVIGQLGRLVFLLISCLCFFVVHLKSGKTLVCRSACKNDRCSALTSASLT